jgi:D-glycero-D-manno-heptose 1,7-bisphosphate phosphatase
MNRALFLDRDGVINVNHGYVHKPEAFDFIEGIFEICRRARQKGYLLIVVTNQAGIGRGYYSEQDFHALTEWMQQQFASRGADIAKVYWCPDHPEFGIGAYKRESNFRKPAPGMILAAADEFNIDLSSSILLGDSATDIQAGKAAGIRNNILYDPEQDFSQEKNVINQLPQLDHWLA